MLGSLSNGDIVNIMLPLTAKYVVYKNIGDCDIRFGWKMNKVVDGEVLCQKEEGIEALWFFDDIKKAADEVRFLNNPMSSATYAAMIFGKPSLSTVIISAIKRDKNLES